MTDERPRPGPGPIARPARDQVTLRLDPQERALWVYLAERQRMSLSQLIRKGMADHIARIFNEPFNEPCAFCHEPWHPHHHCTRETTKERQ